MAEATLEVDRPELDSLRTITLADTEVARLCELASVRLPLGYEADELSSRPVATDVADGRLVELGFLVEVEVERPSLTLEARSLLKAVTAGAVVATIEVEREGELRFLDLAISDDAAVFVERGGDDAMLTVVSPDVVLAVLVKIAGITSRRAALGSAVTLPGDLLAAAFVRGQSFGAQAASALLRDGGVAHETAQRFGAVLANGPRAVRVAVEGRGAVAWFDGGTDGLWLTCDASDVDEVRVVIEPVSAPELVRRLGSVLFD